jgi:heme exporter protein C
MKIVKTISVILVTFTLAAGIAVPVVPRPQSFFEFPYIDGLGDSIRIIFFHVPAAWVSVIGFIISLYNGFKYLRTRKFEYDTKSVSSAGLGIVFCFVALITGSLWAKITWGSFWNWDPRETSIFILLLIYGAYFALRSAIASAELRARLSAVYAILAGFTAPFFVFIMSRVTGGLHPGAKGDLSGSIPITQLDLPLNMLLLLFSGLIGFTLLFIWLLDVRVRLLNNKNQLLTNNQ